MIGKEIYDFCKRIYPIYRSITGNGVRQTLKIIQEEFPALSIYEVPTGTKVFDWEVPKEFNIREAYIENSKKERIVDFAENNLHVLGYSIPVDKIITLDELKKIVYTQPDQPDVIPYVTSYYKERYGFCMSQNQLDSLVEDNYHIYIDSDLKNGNLTYGEILIPGESKEEIFFSTYICHPSMANNECSGPSLALFLAKYVSLLKKRRYSYRFVFAPESIGAIAYCSRNLDVLKKNVKAGFILSCVGDDKTFSYIPSRYGDTLADKISKNVLHFYYPDYKSYTYLDRGSDEKLYCMPGVDLPVAVVCRSKYGCFPEYHTSKDDMNFVSPSGFEGIYNVYKECIDGLENNYFYKITCFCEPQLGKRGLYPTISQKGSYDIIMPMRNILAYADGSNDLIDISNIIDEPIHKLIPIVNKLLENKLLKVV